MAKSSVCSTEEVIPYHIPISVVGFGLGVSIGVGFGTSLNSHQRCLEVANPIEPTAFHGFRSEETDNDIMRTLIYYSGLRV
jgi:hypothetical protein